MPRLLVILALTLTACGGLVGNGVKVTQQREVAEFSTLEVHSGIEVVATRGPRALTLSTDENLVPFVETFVRDGRLVVQFRDNVHLFEVDPVRVEVSNERFEAVSASGASKVTVPASAVESFALEASGASTVRVSGISSAAVAVSASGGSGVSLEGRAARLTVDAGGGSTVQAQALPTVSALVTAHGGSTVRVFVSDTVTGQASGGSTVHVDGAGVAAVTASGGSTVRRGE